MHVPPKSVSVSLGAQNHVHNSKPTNPHGPQAMPVRTRTLDLFEMFRGCQSITKGFRNAGLRAEGMDISLDPRDVWDSAVGA